MPVDGSTGDNRHDSASSGIAKPAAGGKGGNRNGLGGQLNGSDGTQNCLTSGVGNVGMSSSSRSIAAWRGNRGGGESRDGGRIASTSSLRSGCRTCHMARPTFKLPSVAASERVTVGAQPMTVGVFDSHGGSAGLPVLLLGSVPAPGRGMRMMHA